MFTSDRTSSIEKSLTVRMVRVDTAVDVKSNYIIINAQSRRTEIETLHVVYARRKCQVDMSDSTFHALYWIKKIFLHD